MSGFARLVHVDRNAHKNANLVVRSFDNETSKTAVMGHTIIGLGHGSANSFNGRDIESFVRWEPLTSQVMIRIASLDTFGKKRAYQDPESSFVVHKNTQMRSSRFQGREKVVKDPSFR